MSDIPIHVISFPKLCHTSMLWHFWLAIRFVKVVNTINICLCYCSYHQFINHMFISKTWTWVFSQRHQDSNFIALEFCFLLNLKIWIDAITITSYCHFVSFYPSHNLFTGGPNHDLMNLTAALPTDSKCQQLYLYASHSYFAWREFDCHGMKNLQSLTCRLFLLIFRVSKL